MGSTASRAAAIAGPKAPALSSVPVMMTSGALIKTQITLTTARTKSSSNKSLTDCTKVLKIFIVASSPHAQHHYSTLYCGCLAIGGAKNHAESFAITVDPWYDARCTNGTL